MQTIYTPKGRAGEYGDYALNIYSGCPHGCAYCFAAAGSKRYGRSFEPTLREGVVEATAKKLERMQDHGKLIHLCFWCDPYPNGADSTPTREIIRLIKASGNHVQILTKGSGADRDFDLLDENDWFGVTLSCYHDLACEVEPNAAPVAERLRALQAAHRRGIKTWVSFEPVLEPQIVITLTLRDYIDKYKIGKLNYHNPEEYGVQPFDWGEFGRRAERYCKEYGRDYYIKEDLRKEMQ